jgi:hypothetical protein
MTHPLVTQLRFSRREFIRCLEGVNADDALIRVKPMNSLSWIVGHLASQEHFLWAQMAQGENIAPGLQELVGFDRPPSTVPWEEMWTLWREITQKADTFLDDLTTEMLYTHLKWEDEPIAENIGLTLLRNIYHYWFHLGEAHAVRQLLGHSNLPQFVGDLKEVCFDSEE